MGLRKLNDKKTNDKNLEVEITTDKTSMVLTIEDYHNIMFPNAEESGYVGLATKKGVEWSQKMYKTTNWYENIDFDTNCYLTINTFYIPKRQNRTVRHLNALYVDLDIYNMGVSKEDVLQGIEFLVRTKRIYRPTFVISSGRGLYVIWKIEDVPGFYKKTKNMYNHIQEYLVKTFEDLGADAAAKDIARVLRVPGSINTKNNQRVEIIQYNADSLYTMSMFREFIDDFEEYTNKPVKKKTKLTDSKIKRFFNEYTLNKARSEDIEQLCKLREYKVNGQRDTILYIYHYYMMLIHQDEQNALYKTLNLNDRFVEPLTEKEVKSYVKPSVRAYKEHLEDKTKGYNFKNETLIKLLSITKEEQQYMKTIIDTREKYDRNNKYRKNKRRNDDGLTTKQVEINSMITTIKELKEKGYKQKEVAEKLNKGIATIKRYWNK